MPKYIAKSGPNKPVKIVITVDGEMAISAAEMVPEVKKKPAKKR